MKKVLAFFEKFKIGKRLLIVLTLAGSFVVSNIIISRFSHKYDQLGEKNKPLEIVKKEWSLAKLPPEVEEATKDWKTYVSKNPFIKGHFEIKYPAGWYIHTPVGRSPFDILTNFPGYDPENSDLSKMTKDQIWICFNWGYSTLTPISIRNLASNDKMERNYKLWDIEATRSTVFPWYSEEDPSLALEPGNYSYIVADRGGSGENLEVQIRPLDTKLLETAELIIASARYIN